MGGTSSEASWIRYSNKSSSIHYALLPVAYLTYEKLQAAATLCMSLKKIKIVVYFRTVNTIKEYDKIKENNALQEKGRGN